MAVTVNLADLIHISMVWLRLRLIDAGCTSRPARAFFNCRGNSFSRRSIPFITENGIVQLEEVMQLFEQEIPDHHG